MVIAQLSLHNLSSSVQSFEKPLTLIMSNSIVFTSAGIANEIKLKPQALYPVGLVWGSCVLRGCQFLHTK